MGFQKYFLFLKISDLGVKVLAPKEMEELYSGRECSEFGADLIIDTSGNPKAMAKALKFISRGGTFVAFGVAPEGKLME